MQLKASILTARLLWKLIALSISAVNAAEDSTAVCTARSSFVPVSGSCPKLSTNRSLVTWSSSSKMCAVKCGSNKAWCNAFYQYGFNCVMFDYTVRFSADAAHADCPAPIFIRSQGMRNMTLEQCQQSSTLSYSFSTICSNALDGNINGNFSAQSCTHTVETEAGWWQASVSSQSAAYISSVTLYNRVDCCSERLSNFIITVDDNECAKYGSTPFPVGGGSLNCGRIGSVLKIQMLQANSVLTLCEVVVTGF